jgi:hypothetical protein
LHDMSPWILPSWHLHDMSPWILPWHLENTFLHPAIPYVLTRITNHRLEKQPFDFQVQRKKSKRRNWENVYKGILKTKSPKLSKTWRWRWRNIQWHALWRFFSKHLLQTNIKEADCCYSDYKVLLK